ncbi:DUF3221 domain-containing protein [Marinicrinis sediminis]|uniref:DUF3221 domain-containing protein n=1 Tax=Marinicrinis sediminis TaxID=1652465 RepID=A0ABW5RE49_9BACL
MIGIHKDKRQTFKKAGGFILFLLVYLILTGCGMGNEENHVNKKVSVEAVDHKEEPEMTGYIVAIDHDRLLIETGTNDSSSLEEGDVWIFLPEDMSVKEFQKGDEVGFWTTGQLETSDPMSGKAIKIIKLDS